MKVQNQKSLPVVQADPPRNARVEEVARMYEKQFLREMVKAMRQSVSTSELTKPSMAEKIYRDNLDEQYVEVWGNEGGAGLSDIIYKNVMERYFPEQLPAANGRATGPLPLSDRDVLSVQHKQTGTETKTQLKVELAEGPSPATLKAPWTARLVNQFNVGNDWQNLVLENESGDQASFVFQGTAKALKPGQDLDSGTPIGVLSPGIRSFFLNLQQKVEALSLKL